MLNHQTAPKLPPADAIARLPKSVQKAANEVLALRAKHREAGKALDELRSGVKPAQDADLQAGAEAVRAGKDDPGPRATKKLQAEIDAAEPKIAILDAAVSSAESDCLAAIERVAEVERDKLLAEADAEREAIQQTAAGLSDALKARSESFALADWLRDPSRHFGGAYGLAAAPHLRKQNGEPISLPELITEVVAALDPKPEPKDTHLVEGRDAPILGLPKGMGG